MNNSTLTVNTGWLNINTDCNNRCAWCYRQTDLLMPPKRMNFSVAEKLIDFFIELEICSLIFIGGEPTLYPNLEKLILRAKKGGIPEITVVTNGRIFKNTDVVNKYIDSGLSVFSVSIHSASSIIHDHITNTNSWSDTIKGINNIISSGARCSLNVVAGNQNVDDIPESLSHLLDLGVEGIVVSCAIPCIDGDCITGENALNPKRFAKLIDEIASISEKVTILHELPLCLIKKETFLSLIKEGRLGYGCHVCIGNGLSIDVDGTIIPCNSFPHHPVLNLVENDQILYTGSEFLEIWRNSEEVLSIRNEVNVYRSNICAECELWPICNCGCPLTWGCYFPEDYISNELIGISIKSISELAVKKYYL